MYTYSQLQKGVERYVSKYNGDRFQACNDISSRADAIVKETHHTVSEGEAVSWAITGVSPSRNWRKALAFSAPKTKYLVDLLSYVDDSDVRQAVEESFSQSVRLGSLTYYYPTRLNQYQKSRVRVMTRMCWYNR